MTLGSHQRAIGRSQVHLTPRWIIEALGPFDLDPCAADPRPFDCAAQNVTEQEDGLSQQWSGRVWLNPPFDRRVIAAWLARMTEHGDGCVLVHARTETAWFRLIWSSAAAVCFLDRRITFLQPDGSLQRTSSGLVANSGAPVVVAAFGQSNVNALRRLPGVLVTEWAKP